MLPTFVAITLCAGASQLGNATLVEAGVWHEDAARYVEAVLPPHVIQRETLAVTRMPGLQRADFDMPTAVQLWLTEGARFAAIQRDRRNGIHYSR